MSAGYSPRNSPPQHFKPGPPPSSYVTCAYTNSTPLYTFTHYKYEHCTNKLFIAQASACSLHLLKKVMCLLSVRRPKKKENTQVQANVRFDDGNAIGIVHEVYYQHMNKWRTHTANIQKVYS